MFQSEHIVKMFQPEHYAEVPVWNTGSLNWLASVENSGCGKVLPL